MKTLMYPLADWLLIGPTLRDVPLAAKRAAVDQYAITRVVNLWHGADPELAGITSYVHAPQTDGLLNDERVATMDALARHGARWSEEGTLLVQCYGGRNRSGLLAGMILSYRLGISGTEALSIVRAGRGPSALNNVHFARLLASMPSPAVREQ